MALYFIIFKYYDTPPLTSKYSEMKLVYYVVIVIIISLTILIVTYNFPTKIEITTGFLLPKAKPMSGKLNFIDDDNKLVALAKIINNKWLLLYFGYTSCPSICPVEMALANQVVNNMQQKENIIISFVSVDPDNDIGKLDSYAKKFNKNFIGLTAKDNELVNITKELGVYYEYSQIKTRTKETNNHKNHKHNNKGLLIDHTSSFILLDKSMNYVALFTSPHDPKKLAQSLDGIITHYK